MNSIGVGAWRIGVGSSRAVVNPGFWKPQIMGGGVIEPPAGPWAEHLVEDYVAKCRTK